ncbi:MAG: penicillin-binding transpeptidase domain-containing protein [bacterium]|nr:penicillin-binding transpeptidase domain-containing protein [bacterium]
MKLRFTFLYLILFVLFGVLLFRLFNLTLVSGAHNRELADGQRIRVHKIVAPRGVIFDRNGKALVRNVPVFKKCTPLRQDFAGQVKCEEVSRDDALKMEVENKDSDLITEVGREYLYGEAMAHLLGYLGEATEGEVRGGKWGVGSLVGRTGIEQQYEDQLSGQDGGELVEVDTHGVILRKIGRKEPVPGKNIFLSIDADLQKAAYDALEGKKGAVVASDPNTGQVLALVSSPSFDPNVFAPASSRLRGASERARKILNDQNLPMFNRAIGGAYPPGSTFKIVTTTAGLEEGKITPQTEIVDTGELVVGVFSFSNWYYTRSGKTEGSINVIRALARSTDTFFYKLGEMTGAPKIVDWAKKYGVGQISGIDLPGETAGQIPDPSHDWFLGNTYHLAIGQGALGLTVLQDNTMTNVVANGGKLCQPSVVMRSGKGEVESGKKDVRSEICEDIGIKKETLDTIREGLKEVCSPGGTAGVFFNFVPQTACKTGTAEYNDPSGNTHAWLTSYAPYDKPEISVTALVEAGGEGSVVAAPIAKKVMEQYFHKGN